MNCPGKTRSRIYAAHKYIVAKKERFNNNKDSAQPHGTHGSIGSTQLHNRRLIDWMLLLLYTRTWHRLSSKKESHGH